MCIRDSTSPTAPNRQLFLLSTLTYSIPRISALWGKEADRTRNTPRRRLIPLRIYAPRTRSIKTDRGISFTPRLPSYEVSVTRNETYITTSYSLFRTPCIISSASGTCPLPSGDCMYMAKSLDLCHLLCTHLTALHCHDVVWKRPIKVRNLKPLSLFVFFFGTGMRKDFHQNV